MSIPKQSEEVVAGLDSMAADDYLLAELHKMPGDMFDGPIVLGAILLQRQLLEFLRKSILWLNKTLFTKFANCVIEPTQMTDARSELKRAQDALRSHLSVDAYLLMKWEKIATVQAEKLNSLCSKEYHTAHLLKQKDLHSKRLENSGMWAVTDEKFKSWHGDTGGILWCPGRREYQASPPQMCPARYKNYEADPYETGAGKTYLANRIVDELQLAGRHGDVGVAYVYCEYNRSQQQSDQFVIEALARQLIAQKPDLCFEFSHLLENTMGPRLKDRKELLRQVLGRFETTFLVLDALDEFSSEYKDRHGLACTLRNILQDCSTKQVRLCITSREADGIWQALCTGIVPAKFLDVRSSQSDIQALVEKAYDEVSHDRAIEWTYGNDGLRQRVIDEVVKKSDCIFKLADLQIRAIVQRPSAQSAESALSILTRNVNDYYKEAMERIASQRETRDTVYNLLTWLAFTRSPIHVHELELAISIDPEKPLDRDFDKQKVDVLRFVSLSEGLVSINKRSLSLLHENSDKDDQRSKKSTMNKHDVSTSKGAQVTLAHESIREFLRVIPQPEIPADGNKFLLHCCLAIMSSPIFVGNLQPIWRQLFWREKFPSRAKYCFSISPRTSEVEVPVFVFWVLSSWGQYFDDTDLTTDMTNKIHTILKCSPRPNRTPWAGPLFWCAYKGWTEACKVLLPLDEDPNVFWAMELKRGMMSSTSRTCLFAAVASGHVLTVQVFLDDVRIKPNLGRHNFQQGHVTPLMQACQQENGKIVRMLLARDDVDVNECSHTGYSFPAILRADSDIMALLLEREDLDVNILHRGRRPIHHLATIGGSPNELEMLLRNNKTDVNGRTKEAAIHYGGPYTSEEAKEGFCHNRTALMMAAFVGNHAQTSVLLNHPKIELGLRHSQNMSALMLASMGWRKHEVYRAENDRLQDSTERHDETIRVLLTSTDSAINERDMRGRTALMFASMGGVDPRWDGSRTFDEISEKPDLKSCYESLAEKSSLSKDHHVEIVKALLRDDKVDINLADNMGHTALDYAMWTRDFIIQERDWKVQWLKKMVKSSREDGPGSGGLCRVPDIVQTQHFLDKVQSRVGAMSKVHDVLAASGAQSGEPIGSFAVPQDRKPQHHLRLWTHVEASKKQETLESFISALDGIF